MRRLHHSRENIRVILQLGSEARFGFHGDSTAMPLVATKAANPFHALALFPPLSSGGQRDQKDEGCALVLNVRQRA